MSVYWVMLILPVLFGLSSVKVDYNLKKLLLWMTGLVLVILIGLRHEIGGDWFNYLDSSYGIRKGSSFDFSSFMTGDYGYRLIHWISVNHLNGIYSTNFISATFFVAGLIRFCRSMPIPWIALFVSIPFLVVIVSMGYTRQAAAVGLLMWGLIDLINGKKSNFYVFIIIGSLFHLSVLIMLPVGFLYRRKFNFIAILSLFLVSVLIAIIVYFVFKDTIAHLIYFYITIEYMHSDGAVIRVLMSSFAATIFFIFYKKFKGEFNDERLWLIFSIVSIVLLPIAFFYSTFVDRVAIYFLPIQLVVFSRIPILIESSYNRTLFIFGVIFIYVSTLFVWLNFGNFSSYWLPYQNIITA